MPDIETGALALAERVRTEPLGYLTLRQKELRDAFGIGRMTEGLAVQVLEALRAEGAVVVPEPWIKTNTFRIFDEQHPLGALVLSLQQPDEQPERGLREVAELVERARAGRALRSDDVPWIEAFGTFLAVVAGRDPEPWEELHDERHPVLLARTLALALGLPDTQGEAPETMRIAAVVTAFRPKAAIISVLADESVAATPELVGFYAELGQALRWQEKLYKSLLHASANVVLAGGAIPSTRVEMGLVGLRYKRESQRVR